MKEILNTITRKAIESGYIKWKPEGQNWLGMTVSCLKKGTYYKPVLPNYITTLTEDDTQERAAKEIAKIYQNWDYIQEIASNYDHLLGFYQEYQGEKEIQNMATQKINEYYIFLLECLPGNAKSYFQEDNKFHHDRAHYMYFKDYENHFFIYRNIKRGNKSSALKGL